MTLLSVQDRLVPGATLADQVEAARTYGFDAIELVTRPVQDRAREAIRDGVTVSAICAGFRGWLIDPDPENVRLARSDIRELIELAGQLNAGLILVPIYGKSRHLPNAGTGRTKEEDEALFLEGMHEAARYAEQVGARIYLEAINRYENDLCVTVADAMRLRNAIGSPAVWTMGDVFHMNIEEADIGASLEACKDTLGYVHLADSQRLEPGRGHIDFSNVFGALSRLAYEGYASMECTLSGPGDEVLPEVARFLRNQIAIAGGAA